MTSESTLSAADNADRRPLVIASAAAINDAAFYPRRPIRRHDVNVSIERNGLPGSADPCARDDVKQVGSVGVGFFWRKPLRPLRRAGEMQQRVIRMLLDGRVDGPPLEARAREAQGAQFPFKNLEAPVLGRLHLPRVRLRRGVNPAEFDEQVFDIALESRRPRPGENVTHEARRDWAGEGRFLTLNRQLARAALASCFSGTLEIPHRYIFVGSTSQTMARAHWFQFEAPGIYQTPFACQSSLERMSRLLATPYARLGEAGSGRG